MNEYTPLARTKQIGVGLAFLLYPLFAGIAFAVHPNLFSLSISHHVTEKIAEFHGNNLLHFGHVLMLLGAPLLIVVAIHLMNLMKKKQVGGDSWVAFWRSSVRSFWLPIKALCASSPAPSIPCPRPIFAA